MSAWIVPSALSPSRNWLKGSSTSIVANASAPSPISSVLRLTRSSVPVIEPNAKTSASRLYMPVPIPAVLPSNEHPPSAMRLLPA